MLFDAKYYLNVIITAVLKTIGAINAVLHKILIHLGDIHGILRQ